MLRSSLPPVPVLSAASSPPPVALLGSELGCLPSVGRLRMMLGTLVAIEATASCETAALAAVALAYEAIAAVDRLMHPSREGSDVARINGAHRGETVPLDRATWSVLNLAQRVHAASGGTFDPCLPMRPGRLTDLELLGDAGSERCWARSHRPLAIDLGGIAKGYAVDRAIGALQAAGCVAGLVNAGGDLRLFGQASRTILLRRADGACEQLTLENTALAVSGLESRRRPREHQGYYRRNQRGVPRRRYTAVLAPEAVVADALTKCALFGTKVITARALRTFGGVELAGGT